MKVCVVGAGAREHALQHTLSRTARVCVTPGNPGIPGSTGPGVDPEAVEADLYVIGPEAPLVEGLADRLRAAGRMVLGPGADGARLEGSKAWMKELLAEAGVPTARHSTFSAAEPALDFLREMASRGVGAFVVKTDGLAAGKGVLVTESLEEACRDVGQKLSGASFGEAGRTVVIEEGLPGEELSILAVCDGRRFSLLPAAQDHKRLGDGDTGPNTGGIGAYSPVPQVPASVVEDVAERCIAPTLAALRRRGIDYRGVLYAGLMLTPDGPKVIEYNVRFGDPESEAVLPRLEGDVAAWLASAAAGSLEGEASVSPDACLTVVMCAEGYAGPAGPRTGDAIEGLDEAGALEGVTVFHAGTALGPGGRLYTAGGRVLAVTARRPSLAAARELAYRAAGRISWPGVHYRRDVGSRALGGPARGLPPSALGSAPGQIERSGE